MGSTVEAGAIRLVSGAQHLGSVALVAAAAIVAVGCTSRDPAEQPTRATPAAATAPGATAAPAVASRGDAAWEELAATPPMGWNSWNRFHCDVSEELIRETAAAMVATGMRDAGYRYVVIDDCWQVARDSGGHIVADPVRFPHGMKALADHVHGLGLRFGLYTDAGNLTCQRRPGSRGFEAEDARQYAAWGVDYVKYDWCNTRGMDPHVAYATMSSALRATGRGIVFSICEWGVSSPWTWARGVGHLWRTTEDILPCWDCTTEMGGLSWPAILDLQVGLAEYAGPGGWNDPDMLQVGNEGMTVPESRAHFSLWAILAAPLMAGNDLRDMPPETRAILTNRDVIAIDQDALGVQGRKMRDSGDLEVWSKPLADGGVAVVLFNRDEAEREIAVRWSEVGLLADSSPAVRDLWSGRDHGRVPGGFAARVPPHDVVMIRATP
ncbi:MAG TPA: glycoside hydrolase family 27 protein [Candidatus Binatia bacterium]|nr:glycoside hydrolase family 27 protein [Candidatus Binatia bacterium]